GSGSEPAADVVGVAPCPALAGLGAADDRVAGLLGMSARVLVDRGVAAADSPAGQAEAQVHPGVTDLEARLAPAVGYRPVVHLDQVLAGGVRHRILHSPGRSAPYGDPSRMSRTTSSRRMAV